MASHDCPIFSAVLSFTPIHHYVSYKAAASPCMIIKKIVGTQRPALSSCRTLLRGLSLPLVGCHGISAKECIGQQRRLSQESCLCAKRGWARRSATLLPGSLVTS